MENRETMEKLWNVLVEMFEKYNEDSILVNIVNPLTGKYITSFEIPRKKWKIERIVNNEGSRKITIRWGLDEISLYASDISNIAHNLVDMETVYIVTTAGIVIELNF